MNGTLKAADIFSGLGGWSDGLVLEGFQVLGVEIEPKIAGFYQHPCLVADARELKGEWFKDFDLIVGSPPCREFTRLPDKSVTKKGIERAWKKPKNPIDGLELVHAFLNIIADAKPKYWLMENVPGLIPYLDDAPQVVTRLSKGMRRAFWGRFPPFLVTRDFTKTTWTIGKWGKHKKWKRAKIPLPVARALGRAVRNALTEVTQTP